MSPTPPHIAEAHRSLDLRAEAVWPPATLIEVAGWRCRLDRGVTRRANSVLAADWQGGDLDARLDEVEKIYRSKALPPCFQINPQSRPAGLEAALAARGYATEGASLVQGLDLAQDARPSPGLRIDPEVRLHDAPSPGWLALLAGGGDPAAAAAKAAILARVQEAKVYLSIGPEAAPLAMGTGLRAGDTVWANNMYTAPDARGRGLAGRILAAIAGWALDQGVTRFHLQVEADNHPARRLYEGFGFRPLYPYRYRVLAAGAGDRAC